MHGEKYNFYIQSGKFGEYILFSIRAVCKKSRRYSSINNLNVILSELQVDFNDRKYEDSLWYVNMAEAERLAEITKETIKDENFLAYLESQLDIDRRAGEWENRLN